MIIICTHAQIIQTHLTNENKWRSTVIAQMPAYVHKHTMTDMPIYGQIHDDNRDLHYGH